MRCTMKTITTTTTTTTTAATAVATNLRRSQRSIAIIFASILLLLAGCGISQIQSLEESHQLNATPPPPQPPTAIASAPLPTTTTTTTTTTAAPNTNKNESLSSNSGGKESKKWSAQEPQLSISTTTNNDYNMSNKQQATTTSDFAPDSIEAKVADATTRFGLNFIKNLDRNKQQSSRENVVISPLSLQNLLNMILLGSDNKSATEQELIKVLGYEATELIGRNQQQQQASDAGSLRPHEAMHSVLNSIMKATQLAPTDQQASPVSGGTRRMSELLNSNSFALNNNATTTPSDPDEVLTAHLESNVDQSAATSTGAATSASGGALVNFTLANLILTDESVSLNDRYTKQLKAYYKVNVEQFSRKKNKSNTTNDTSISEQLPLHERVNNWVKNMTQNQIEKLAEASDLEGPLLMILLNAAHFKGRWLYTFNQKSTQDQAFFNFGDENSISEVPFMRQKGNFGYADFGQSSGGGQTSSNYNSQDARAGAKSESSVGGKTSASDDAETLLTVDRSTSVTPSSSSSSSKADNDDQETVDSQLPIIELSKEESKRLELTSKLNCSALMLPFALNDGQELSLIILLPTKRDGLGDLMDALSYQNLNEIYRSLSEQQVQVELPKFSFESSHDAKDILEKIGLKQMFAEAHLNKMFKASTPSESKKIGKVIHKAKIAVDESGAEAAAASMATVFLRHFIRPPTPTFVADHPFLFIIRHNRSNMPLFMGQVNKFT